MTDVDDEGVAAENEKPIQVFVASPIGSPGTDSHRDALTTLNYVIRKALTEPRWKVLRADFETAPDSISQGVVRRILESDLIVVDLSDHNPNVFYELAIAHCYRKPVVLIAAKGTRIPFDVADQRTIFYDLTSPESVDNARTHLLAAANHALKSPDALVTPLTNMQRLTEITTRIEAGDSDQLTDLLENVATRLSRIERAVTGARSRRNPVENVNSRLVVRGRPGSAAKDLFEDPVAQVRWDRVNAAYMQQREVIAGLEQQQHDAFADGDAVAYEELSGQLAAEEAALTELEDKSLRDFGLSLGAIRSFDGGS